MEVPSGTTAGTPTAVAAVHHVRLGQADLQGRVHEPHLHVQALHARRRAAARRRQAQLTQAGRAAQGPEPDHARAGRLRHAPRQGRRHAALDLLRAPTATRRSWRLIAEANGVDNPLHLRRGSLAVAPERSRTDAGRRAQAKEHVAGDRRPRRRRATRPQVRATHDRGQGRRQPDAARHGARADHRPQGRERSTANPLQARHEHRDQGVGDMGDRATTSIFKGQIAAVEPEFTPQGVVISVRAYDKAHKLNRQRKTRTFQQMSASDMVAQDRRRGRPGRAQDRVHERRPRVLPAEQRDRLGLRSGGSR